MKKWTKPTVQPANMSLYTFLSKYIDSVQGEWVNQATMELVLGPDFRAKRRGLIEREEP